MNKIHRKKNCPYGTKALDLLHSKKVSFEDNVFASKSEEQDFKAENSVSTTPQIWIDGKHVGGYSDLVKYYGVSAPSETTTYQPVVAVFTVALLLAASTELSFRSFMGYSLTLLATLKLMDLQTFGASFMQYDLLAMKTRFYALVYPFLELAVGLSFISLQFSRLFASLSVVIGLISLVSIVKAVYVDKLDLNCACVGGNSNVPLGLVSTVEALMMVVMGIVASF